MLEKTLESPLDCKEIQSVHPKGNQSWVFIGRTDVEAETPILWPPYVKNGLIGKDPDAGKVWRQEEKGTTEDEMVGWHTDSMDTSLSRLWEYETCWSAVRGVAKSRTRLSDWTELTELEKGMAAHSSILARRIPWTEEPGRLQSLGSQRDMTERLSIQSGICFLPIQKCWASFLHVLTSCLQRLTLPAQQNA